MKKHSIWVGFFAFMTLGTFVQAQEKESHHYLSLEDVANSLELLPPPPAVNSILFLNDEAQYRWGKMQRPTPRGDQAVSDARLYGDGVAKSFSEAFGMIISKELYAYASVYLL